MDSIDSLHPLARAWLLDGPLSPYADAFSALMERGRYAEGTVSTDLRALAHFAHWMTRCRLAADQIDESLSNSSWPHTCLDVIAMPRHCAHTTICGPTSALLPNREGRAMTRSNVTQRLAVAVRAATRTAPSLVGRVISPHSVRHSTAMHLLQSGVDISVIALWLGHESPTTTHQYIEADLAMKEKALARLQDPGVVARRFRADDSLLDFLKTL